MLVIVWERKKKVVSKEELLHLELDLDTLYFEFLRGFVQEVDKELVMEKEKRKLFHLRQEELTWR